MNNTFWEQIVLELCLQGVYVSEQLTDSFQFFTQFLIKQGSN